MASCPAGTRIAHRRSRQGSGHPQALPDLSGCPRPQPELIGGSADLTHSNYTDIKGETGSYQPETPEKRYLHFVEHAMAAILNGTYTTAVA